VDTGEAKVAVVICSYTHCETEFDPYAAGPAQRFCSRACQVAQYRRSHTRRTYVVLTVDEHRALQDLADDCGTTIDEIAAEIIREGLQGCGA
jgi:hypothetical protein